MYTITSKSGKQMQIKHLDLSVLMGRIDDDLSGTYTNAEAREVAEVLRLVPTRKATVAPHKRKGRLISHKTFKQDLTDISVDEQIKKEFKEIVEEGGFEVGRIF